MKTNNKKLVMGLVAAFMAVVLAGAAFAAGGNLEFLGTARLNTDLDVRFTSVTLCDPATVDITIANDRKSVEVDFIGTVLPGDDFVLTFTVENEGALAALLNLAQQGTTPFVVLDYDLEDVPLAVGATHTNTVDIEFVFSTPTDPDAGYEDVSFTLYLNYVPDTP